MCSSSVSLPQSRLAGPSPASLLAASPPGAPPSRVGLHVWAELLHGRLSAWAQAGGGSLTRSAAEPAKAAGRHTRSTDAGARRLSPSLPDEILHGVLLRGRVAVGGLLPGLRELVVLLRLRPLPLPLVIVTRRVGLGLRRSWMWGSQIRCDRGSSPPTPSPPARGRPLPTARSRLRSTSASEVEATRGRSMSACTVRSTWAPRRPKPF